MKIGAVPQIFFVAAREMQQQYGPIHIEFNETSFFISSRYFAEYSSHSHAAPAPG